MLLSILALTSALAAAPEAELAIGIRSENRAGVASIIPGQDPVAVADFVLVPSLSLGLLSASGGLRISYQPRLFQRVPLSAGFKPLLFQQFDGVFNWRLSDVWNLGINVRGGVGSVNYTYAGTAFQASNPDVRQDPPVADETLSFGNLNAGLTNEIRVGPTTRIRFGGSAQYTAATNTDQLANALPRQIRVSGAGGFTFTPNGRDGLDVIFTGDMADFLDVANHTLGFFSARVGWIRTVDRRTQCTAHVGALLLLSPSTPDQPRDPVSAAPAGDLGCTFGLIRTLDVRGNLAIQLGVQGYADPIRVSVTPRAIASAAFSLQLPPDWTLGVVGNFYTPIAGPLVGAGASSIYLAETLIEGRLPITYRVSDEFQLEGGARFLTRGPRFTDPAFRFGAIEGQGYLALSFGYSTRENRHQRDQVR